MGAPTPTSIAYMGLGTQAVGALGSMATSYYSAKIQNHNAAASAAIAEANARIAKANAGLSDLNAIGSEMAAESVMQQGDHQIAALTLQAGQTKSRQKVSLAANGVDMSEGSAREVQQSAELMKNVDKATLRMNALREAWGHKVQAFNHMAQGDSMRLGADMPVFRAPDVNPWGSAATSLMGSATSISHSWLQYLKTAK